MEEEYVQSEDNKVTKEPETNYHYSGSKTKDFYSYIEGSQSKEGESVSYTNTPSGSRIQDFYNFVGNSNKNQEAGFTRVSQVSSGDVKGMVKKMIAGVESRDSYTAKNPNSTAYGKYQFLKSTYQKAADALGMSYEKIRTPMGQEVAMDWLLKENTKELGNRGIEVTPLNLYGIHQQGGKVFEKMVKGERLTSDELELIEKNTPEKYRSGNPVDDWFSFYSRKFS